ncbi:GntR family transcriptional regulator [Epibacterium ulvae]|uniref:GntR family transcriptional regulator n=1 Tax=Epibacterium ulvae TaxID=1156985 RepID=UPI001BFC4C5B|nr:GntR family transcriptional regulator [Epibacterium ulvae]MBT8154180.1 GntR family transcriptional regulator [Epibacterium ulvae]
MGDTTPDPSATVRDRHEALHAEIRRRICLLDYAPGQRLSEVALAEEFGTSRTPMRRVLARLEDEGLVQSLHGVGTLVTDADIAALEQEYHLRLELTELTGRLDPVMPDAVFLATLDQLIARGAQMVRDGTPRDFTAFDMEVFQVLLQLTGNLPLRDTLERLYYKTKRIWLTAAIEAQLDLQAEFRIFHHELEAIRIALHSGDLDAVAHIQRAHISMSFQRLRKQRD